MQSQSEAFRLTVSIEFGKVRLILCHTKPRGARRVCLSFQVEDRSYSAASVLSTNPTTKALSAADALIIFTPNTTNSGGSLGAGNICRAGYDRGLCSIVTIP